MLKRLALALAVVVAGATGVWAAEWNLIVPGTTTKDQLRARHGEPTRTVAQRIEGYDTTQAIYEGREAPVGMNRMTVDFGLLTPDGYRAEIVRSFTLEPKPGIFTRTTIISGWGAPDRTPPGGAKQFFYDEGLLVFFDSEGWMAERMTFTPPQPARDGAPPPR